jgi:D-glycero-alpha-D-manno-heptose-7-phosphate kinase
MILTQTPLRVSLFGGGTDYPEWFLKQGGAVLGTAIDKYVYVGVQPMPLGQELAPGVPLRYRVQYSKVDDSISASDIKHPIVKAMLRYYGIDTPLEFHCFGDLPGKAGLGSSSAFCVGALRALRSQLGIQTTDSPLDLASEVISFERHVIPETVGFQDQIFAAVGGLNVITFGPTGSYIRKIELPPERLLELERSLVLVYTGTMRDAHAMATKQVDRIPSNRNLLDLMSLQVEAGVKILLDEKAPLSDLGEMLNAAWLVKKDLHPEISSLQIDALYSKGLAHGALGGKLLGAGNGGFFLFFVPPEYRSEFELGIGAPCIEFKMTEVGCRVVSLTSRPILPASTN